MTLAHAPALSPVVCAAPLLTHLARRLVAPERVAQLLLADGARRVNLVAEDQERHPRELLDGEQRVELRAALAEALVVLCVDEEDDAVDLGEVVLPQPAG